MTPPSGTSLPVELFDLIEFTPLEDIALHHLRAGLPDAIHVNSLIADDQTFPLVLVRRTPDWGWWEGDERFIDQGQITIHAYAYGVEADSDAAFLSEAVRNVLRVSKNVVVPELGHISHIEMIGSPHRASDWATSSGPVQYADLPTGVVRYESVYKLTLRTSRGA